MTFFVCRRPVDSGFKSICKWQLMQVAASLPCLTCTALESSCTGPNCRQADTFVHKLMAKK